MMNLKPVLLALPVAFACYAPNSLAQDLPFFQSAANGTTAYTLSVVTGNGDLNIEDFEVEGSYDKDKCTGIEATQLSTFIHVITNCGYGYCYTVSDKDYPITSEKILESFGTGVKCLRLSYTPEGGSEKQVYFNLSFSGGSFTATPSTGTINFTS